jgi:hypothetical protein
MRSQPFRTGVAALLLAYPLLAQTVVFGGGPALQNAITAAAVGDLLVVQAGDYDAVTIDKGLTIHCEPGVRLLSGTQACVQMHVIPAGQTARWYGGEMVQTGVLAEFRVFLCNGVVEVEGVLSGNCITNDSPQTSFTNCEFTIRTQVDNSKVLFSNCILHRQLFCSGTVCSGLEVINGGTAWVVDSTIIGPPGLVFFPASPGIYLDDGTIHLGGAITSVAGGSPSVPAIRFGSVGGTIEADSLVQINGSIDGVGSVTPSTTPSTSTVGGSEGDTVSVMTYSEPGSFALSFVGLPLPRTLTPFGELWMVPPVITVAAGLVPANSELPGNFVIPVGAYGRSLTFQAGAILSNGDIVLGIPTVALYR